MWTFTLRAIYTQFYARRPRYEKSVIEAGHVKCHREFTILQRAHLERRLLCKLNFNIYRGA